MYVCMCVYIYIYIHSGAPFRPQLTVEGETSRLPEEKRAGNILRISFSLVLVKTSIRCISFYVHLCFKLI